MQVSSMGGRVVVCARESPIKIAAKTKKVLKTARMMNLTDISETTDDLCDFVVQFIQLSYQFLSGYQQAT
jgi:hypothetical protein